LSGSAGIESYDQSHQSPHNVGVGIPPKGQLGSVRGFCDQPDLARTAPDLVLITALCVAEGGKVAAQIDDVAIAFFLVAEHLKLGFQIVQFVIHGRRHGLSRRQKYDAKLALAVDRSLRP